MTSLGLGVVGLFSVVYTLIIVMFWRHLPPAIVYNPIPTLGCWYWSIAPIGALTGALVLDERLDVVRWARVGILLNVIAFCGAAYVSYVVLTQFDFD